MTTLRDFIAVRLDEDEAAARAASQGKWEVDDPEYPHTIHANDYEAEVVSGGRWGGEASVFDRKADPLHIIRYDPARVLREVAAKRAILERHGISQGDGCTGCGVYLGRDDKWHPNVAAEDCEDLQALAAIWPEHPDFDSNWSTI
ncbi:DUF6221 family protein [Glycomyces sp. NPDC021274]|uniref:DUF6221 family protein n=1 Tax=Glycomyces sp. NPDC021274 TaxID=3155120 RepID=UPI0033D49C3A